MIFIALALANANMAVEDCTDPGSGEWIAWCATALVVATVAIDWDHIRLRARRALRRWRRA